MEMTPELLKQTMDTYRTDDETHVQETIELTGDEVIDRRGFEYIRKLVVCRSHSSGWRTNELEEIARVYSEEAEAAAPFRRDQKRDFLTNKTIQGILFGSRSVKRGRDSVIDVTKLFAMYAIQNGMLEAKSWKELITLVLQRPCKRFGWRKPEGAVFFTLTRGERLDFFKPATLISKIVSFAALVLWSEFWLYPPHMTSAAEPLLISTRSP
ncbi:hypothetical protein LTR84_012511 [Exophiala bonariae]|uniref:Uncharacterized protein n=1 Tax=Exophiala bonariae TaxID=1690606 RepID=A0AAV9NHX3_9EURO|nr:hypothetical protein LTR84_012511 [Exophiala bonariae]